MTLHSTGQFYPGRLIQGNPGLLAPLRPAIPLVSTFVDSATDGANATGYTFTGRSLGTAAFNRYILIGISTRSTTDGVTITGTNTIGGMNFTPLNFINSGIELSAYSYAGFGIAHVPAGATGDIIINFSATMVRCGLAVWRLVNLLSPTPHAMDSDALNNPLTASLNVPRGGSAFAMVYAPANATATSSWTGLTERLDTTVELTTQNVSAASDDFSATQTGLSIEATISAGSSAEVLSAIALR